MAILRLWPSTDGPASTDVDSTDYSLGVEFFVTDAADATAVYLWRPPSSPATTFDVAIYEVTGDFTGTLLGSVTGVSAPANENTWHRVELDTPIPLTPNQHYRAVAHSNTDDFFGATGAYWSSGPGAAGLVNDILNAPGVTGAQHSDQGSFTVGSSLAYPASSFNGANYWVDVEVDSGGGTEYTADPADPVGITDTAEVTLDTARAVADPVGVTDSVDVATDALRTISDAVGITDSVQVNLRKATRGMYGLTACWPDPVICEDCCSEEVSGLDPTMWQTIQDTAVDFLWRATGKQYGVCENTYRPCRRTCNGTAWGWPIGTPFIPWRINDQWTNLSCTSCPGECGCGGAVSEIRLTSIESVTGVRIEGVDLTPEDTVAVYDRYRIVRIDGEEWPTCQNLAATDGAGTWSVTVQQGVPVPAGGDLVAGILACEYAKACLNSKDCRLPRSVQSLVRQGVTMELGVPDIGDMLTGIYEVDSWIIKGRETRWQAPSILSPDRRPAARMTWPVVEA